MMAKNSLLKFINLLRQPSIFSSGKAHGAVRSGVYININEHQTSHVTQAGGKRRRFPKKSILLFFLLNLVLLIPIAWAQPHKNSLLSFSVMLDWLPNPDHASLFIAKEKGFFKKYGLDVKFITPADPDAATKLVAAGKADAAITYEPSWMLEMSRGLPLVRFATLINHPLSCLVVLKSSAIYKIEDLKGKTIGYSSAVIDDSLLKSMLQFHHLALNDVHSLNVHYNLLQGLLTNRIDAAMGLMRNVELIQLKNLGKPGRAFYPEENGIPPYDELILVTSTQHKNDPRLKSFVAALTDATQYLLKNPEDCWKTFASNHPELNTPVNHQIWQATLPYFDKTPGWVDLKQYRRFYKFIIPQGKASELPAYLVDMS